MSSCKSFLGFPLQSETSRIDRMLRAEIRFLRFYDVIVFTHVIVVFLAYYLQIDEFYCKEIHLQQILLLKKNLF